MTDILRSQIKTILFISSYTLLFLILIIKNLYSQEYLPFIINGVEINMIYVIDALLGAAIIVSNAILLISIRFCKSAADEFVKVKSIENMNSVNAEYLVTYIIPFLSIDPISLLLLFFVFAFLYVKSDMIYINPTLNFAGYNLIEVRTKEDEKLILITKAKDRKKIESIKFRRITDSILVG